MPRCEDARMFLSETPRDPRVEMCFADVQVDGRAHNLFADGFAFWITKDRATSGPVFGSVGGYNAARMEWAG